MTNTSTSIICEKPCKKFSLDAIQKATDNFNVSKIIGKGGFGNVYKGVVDDGLITTVFAMKRLNQGSRQGVDEFKTEIQMLSMGHHCHLVPLVGYCTENHEMILVYEYMSNGTLADHLYKNPNSLLRWAQRLKICIGAARGLEYLHNGTGNSCGGSVIHLDVKSDNILLDENWAAKIADLGLSKIVPQDHLYSEMITDHVRGTRGYTDPHYRVYHKYSSKTDVYSFGVVLLEVLTGTRIGGMVIPNPDVITPYDWIRQHITDKTLDNIIDQRVLQEMEPKCLQVFADTARKTLHDDPRKRPSMNEVVVELESALAFQNNMNLSSSITEDIGKPFNAFRNEIQLETISKVISFDKDKSSDHHIIENVQEIEAYNGSHDLALWPRIKGFIVGGILRLGTIGITVFVLRMYLEDLIVDKRDIKSLPRQIIQFPRIISPTYLLTH